jgi:DAACS family dicarboxylate/amino acid:cation (Na+ or H+) symporter
MMLGTVGIPAEGIALIIGVDRVLDMSRTTLNVAGDLVAACVIAQNTPRVTADSVVAAGAAVS